MGVESVGEDVEMGYCYCPKLSVEEIAEKERMEAIGRATLHLFNLLQQESVPSMPLKEVIVVLEPIVVAVEDDTTLEKTAEQLEQMIKTYENQIILLRQSIEQERKQLQIQETIERLHFENPSFLARPSERKKEILGRIAGYEAEICSMEAKLPALRQTLQDMQNSV